MKCKYNSYTLTYTQADKEEFVKEGGEPMNGSLSVAFKKWLLKRRKDKDNLQIVTVNVPLKMFPKIEELMGSSGLYTSRSELIRVAVRDYLIANRSKWNLKPKKRDGLIKLKGMKAFKVKRKLGSDADGGGIKRKDAKEYYTRERKEFGKWGEGK